MSLSNNLPKTPADSYLETPGLQVIKLQVNEKRIPQADPNL